MSLELTESTLHRSRDAGSAMAHRYMPDRCAGTDGAPVLVPDCRLSCFLRRQPQTSSLAPLALSLCKYHPAAQCERNIRCCDKSFLGRFALESGRAPRGYIMLSGIIGGSCHEYNFCRHKHMFVTKHVFVATKHVFCRDKTRLLSRQNYATNIILSRQSFCRYKHIFVTTNTCLSWHSKIMFLATYNCDKYLSQKA